MIVNAVLAGLVLFLLIVLNWCGAWLRYYRRTDLWIARRDAIFNEIYSICITVTQAARPHSDAEWGYEHGMPSKNSLALLDVARAIEKERWGAAQLLKKSLSYLDEWQRENPPPLPPTFWGLQTEAPIEYAKFEPPEIPESDIRTGADLPDRIHQP